MDVVDSVPGNNTTTTSVAIGSSINGVIDSSTDHDWYRVSLTAGQSYVFSTGSYQGSDVDTLLTLRIGNVGVSVTSDDDSGPILFSRIAYTATTTGTYFLDVSTVNGETGAFTLSAALASTLPADTVPGSTATSATLSLGGTAIGAIETDGDHDWYRVPLTAGQTYIFSTLATGSGDVDTTLALRDAFGTQLAFNDDAGTSSYSSIRYTATSSGTYYVDVGGYADQDTGAFKVSMAQAAALPVYTNDQIAYQLATAYWNGDAHHFNVRTGGTLTYDITGLTAAGQTLARAAFGMWSDATGLNFEEVTGNAQITIDDNSSGAATSAIYSHGITSSATINIGTDWLADYGTSLTSYSFQTYIHEIGHALGLGHAGDYNDNATYATDALYANDSWATTVMSYFDEHENTYTASLGFTEQFTLSPMVADAIATTSLYGTDTTTRTGDTTYGFNNTSGRQIYDATFNSAGGYTIFDDGGNDTLDYSGFSQNQTINLNPETFSNIGPGVGNVTIARGTVIENAIGGSGNDTLIGNAVANMLVGGAGDDTLTGGGGGDVLTGGSGNNIFSDTLADMNGDRITDFTTSDRILITDYSTAATSGYSYSNGVLTIAGDTITVGGYTGGLTLHLGSGGQASFTAASTDGDFNGDNHADILWRNTNGALSTWTVVGNGTAVQQGAYNGTVAASWHAVETLDFNGDGKADILWRQDGGAVAIWDSTGSGFNTGSYYRASAVPTSWRIAATGDLNGDGKGDILWQNTDGSISSWTSTGTNFNEAAYTRASPGAGWQVEALGDFNGDGEADILWRNTNGSVAMWTNNGNGTSFNEGAFYQVGVPSSWHVAGVGDFNGDGKDDILWRNDSGAVTLWTSNGTNFTEGVYNTTVPTSWHIVQVGDFNDDGKADILWKNDNGAVSTWQSNGSGFDQAVYSSSVPAGWSVAAHAFVL